MILSQAVGTMIFTTVCASFRGSNTPRTFKRHLLMSTMRKAFARQSTAQTQNLFGGSREANYLAWMKQQGIAPWTVTLADGATKAFWIGDSHAESVVVYLHGGGFVMRGSHGQLSFTSSVVSAVNASNKKLAFRFLQYDLMPQSRYPH